PARFLGYQCVTEMASQAIQPCGAADQTMDDQAWPCGSQRFQSAIGVFPQRDQPRAFRTQVRKSRLVHKRPAWEGLVVPVGWKFLAEFWLHQRIAAECGM